MPESNIRDPRAEALEYMKQHKIETLFNILGAKLAKSQPKNPNEFILAELTKIAGAKANGLQVTLFSREDLDTMFTTFDLTGKGYVNQTQYQKALAAIGADDGLASLPKNDRIDRETFVGELYNEIMKRAF